MSTNGIIVFVILGLPVLFVLYKYSKRVFDIIHKSIIDRYGVPSGRKINGYWYTILAAGIAASTIAVVWLTIFRQIKTDSFTIELIWILIYLFAGASITSLLFWGVITIQNVIDLKNKLKYDPKAPPEPPTLNVRNAEVINSGNNQTDISKEDKPTDPEP